jgi:predicted MPP superfamily phosphohydrolase
MFHLAVNTKTLIVPRLPAELDGLSITHLSDLHFTGKITRPFFDRVMEETMALHGDLIAITGDIQESEQCYAWLPLTLGQLRAPQGVYFVLGNHDRRMQDVGRLRQELTSLGLVDLGVQTQEFTARNQLIQLAGNELPWFGPPRELPARTSQPAALRILLSHSPDQIRWAGQRDFDLMLAGHTHGGHIRFPIVGPVVCPSRYGVKYAAGVFYERPTLLHVSRGISGLDPVRFNCPPELTKLVLRSGEMLEDESRRAR